MLTPEERRAKIGAVIRVASGNFLERGASNTVGELADRTRWNDARSNDHDAVLSDYRLHTNVWKP